MTEPLPPPDERRRLRTLRLYKIMDTASDQLLDQLAHLASTICEAPISLVSLVDDHRQWFKARVGLNAEETPRSMAFCAHALESDELLVVEDATRDHRFADNPLVTAEPRIRFYAGAPLRVREGDILGTLCVIDHEPRKLTVAQRQALKILSRAAVAQIELLRTRQEIEQFEKILPMCAWCHAVRDEDGGWQPLDEYVKQAVNVSHGICPECLQQHQLLR